MATNSQDWVILKSGAWYSIQISQAVAGAQTLELCFPLEPLLSQDISQELNEKWNSQGTNWCQYEMPVLVGRELVN